MGSHDQATEHSTLENVMLPQLEEDRQLFGDRELPEQDDPMQPYRVEDWPGKSHSGLISVLPNFQASLSEDKLQHDSPPIMRWLDEATPPYDPVKVHESRESANRERDESRLQESKDLEYFRNVQVTESVDRVADVEAFPENPAFQEDENGTQFFYRNIRDCYPRIEQELALRLASLNWARAKRVVASASTSGLTDAGSNFELTPQYHDLPSKRKAPLIHPAETSKRKRLNLPRRDSSDLCSQAPENYWTRNSHPSSPASSRNSPLRDAEMASDGEQNQSPTGVFLKSRRPMHRVKCRTNLPPPPVRLGYHHHFPCDICGRRCSAQNMKQWKSVSHSPFRLSLLM